MSDDLEKIILEMRDDIRDIKKYIPSTDIVTNEQYCEYRTAKGSKLTVRGLRGWFERVCEEPCPREDSRHVSKADVDNWAKKHNTRGRFKPKVKKEVNKKKP